MATSLTTAKRLSKADWAPFGHFPLSLHKASGRLYKTANGRRTYFGYLDRWDEALLRWHCHEAGIDADETVAAIAECYREFKDRRLDAGCNLATLERFYQSIGGIACKDRPTPALLALRDELAGQPEDNRLTVKALTESFLADRRYRVEAGELSRRSLIDYEGTCRRLNRVLREKSVESLTPDDFRKLRSDIAKTRQAFATGTEIQRVRCVFNFGVREGLLDNPPKYGAGFERPTKKKIRLEKAQQPEKLFDAHEIRALLDVASPQLRGMVLLAVNAGLGNSDLARLEFQHLDLQNGWVSLPREKTGTPRRCPLWPETLTAINAYLATRREPKNAALKDRVFVTRCGAEWIKPVKGGFDDSIAKEFNKLQESLGIKQQGRAFYSLRHSFRTVADGSRDTAAADYIMGHRDPHIRGTYIHAIDDERLRAVTDHVRLWLFGEDRGQP